EISGDAEVQALDHELAVVEEGERVRRAAARANIGVDVVGGQQGVVDKDQRVAEVELRAGAEAVVQVEAQLPDRRELIARMVANVAGGSEQAAGGRATGLAGA